MATWMCRCWMKNPPDDDVGNEGDANGDALGHPVGHEDAVTDGHSHHGERLAEPEHVEHRIKAGLLVEGPAGGRDGALGKQRPVHRPVRQ